MVITGNTATTAAGDAGGGIWNTGNLTITGSTISGNMAPNENAGCGGVWSNDSLTVVNSTISGNTSSGAGAGIHNNNGVAMIRHSTITDNQAARDGGGVFNFDGLTVIEHSTITNNEATSEGDGVWSYADNNARSVVRSSIIAGNASGEDVYYEHGAVNSFQSLGYNLIGGGNATGAFTAMGDRTIGAGGDPLLGPLADNGGPTQTHALLAGSPAIDMGDPAAMAGVGGVPQFDQRGSGFDRVHQGRIDIGAFEVDQFDLLPPAVVAALNDAGIDLEDFPQKLLDALIAANEQDLLTEIPSGTPADNVSLQAGEVVVLGDGAQVNNIDGGPNTTVVVGQDADVNGNFVDVESIFMAGGNVSGDIQNVSQLGIGAGASVNIDGNVDGKIDVTEMKIASGAVVNINGNMEAATLTLGGGAVVNINGNMEAATLTLGGGAVVNINGNMEAATLTLGGGAVLDVDGNLEFSNSLELGENATLDVAGNLECSPTATVMIDSTATVIVEGNNECSACCWPLMIDGGTAVSFLRPDPVTEAVLGPVVEKAIAYWSLAEPNPIDLDTLREVDVRIADLSGSLLGLASAKTVWIDRDAAGHGWSTSLDGVDLLTVVAHEFGHVLGFGHDHHDSVMRATLSPGAQRSPVSRFTGGGLLEARALRSGMALNARTVDSVFSDEPMLGSTARNLSRTLQRDLLDRNLVFEEYQHRASEESIVESS